MQTTVINLLSPGEYQAAFDMLNSDIDHAWFVQQLNDVPAMKKFVMIRPRAYRGFWIIAEVEVPPTKNLEFDRQKHEPPRLRLRFKNKTAWAFKGEMHDILAAILTNTTQNHEITEYPL
jgi:hypothetical protein